DDEPESDDWLPADGLLGQDVDPAMPEMAAWMCWIRDDLKAQSFAWLLASLAVLRADVDNWHWPRGLMGHLLSSSDSSLQRGIGWFVASSMSLAWATGDLQMVFTFEQRAMLFAPWSVLVFVQRRPVVGSVIIFSGCDSRSYVRRVKAIQSGPDASLNRKGFSARLRLGTEGSLFQTSGDLPGAAEDRPLYSADGSADWLDGKEVRGVLAAGPFPVKVLLVFLAIAVLVSPGMTIAYLATSQPILIFWLLLVGHFCQVVFGGGVLV
ncbi:unnamed protein product, partial [Polarella glacialis]